MTAECRNNKATNRVSLDHQISVLGHHQTYIKFQINIGQTMCLNFTQSKNQSPYIFFTIISLPLSLIILLLSHYSRHPVSELAFGHHALVASGPLILFSQPVMFPRYLCGLIPHLPWVYSGMRSSQRGQLILKNVAAYPHL